MELRRLAANSTGSFDAGYWVGGVLGGFNQGYQEGAAIVADTATLGEVDSIHSYANTACKAGYIDASRGLAAVGIGSARSRNRRMGAGRCNCFVAHAVLRCTHCRN